MRGNGIVGLARFASMSQPSARTVLGRHRERGRHDTASLYGVLDAALICHLGVSTSRGPLVLPTIHGRASDTLYLHGSTGAQALQLADGMDICLTATIVDGVVLARSVFQHSMNYRSAVVFGRARLVLEPDEKLLGLRTVTEHVMPGRWDEARRPSRKELAATSVLALGLTEASVKVRTGPPSEPGSDDLGLDVWAGVLGVSTIFRAPEPDAETERANRPAGWWSALNGQAVDVRRAIRASVPDS